MDHTGILELLVSFGLRNASQQLLRNEKAFKRQYTSAESQTRGHVVSNPKGSTQPARQPLPEFPIGAHVGKG